MLFVFSRKPRDPVRLVCVAVMFTQKRNSRAASVEQCLMDALRGRDTAS